MTLVRFPLSECRLFTRFVFVSMTLPASAMQCWLPLTHLLSIRGLKCWRARNTVSNSRRLLCRDFMSSLAPPVGPPKQEGLSDADNILHQGSTDWKQRLVSLAHKQRLVNHLCIPCICSSDSQWCHCGTLLQPLHRQASIRVLTERPGGYMCRACPLKPSTH